MAADFAEEKAVSIMAAARWSLTKDTIETWPSTGKRYPSRLFAFRYLFFFLNRKINKRTKMKSRKTHSGSRAICTYSQNGREPRQREIKARPFHGPSAGDKVCALLKKASLNNAIHIDFFILKSQTLRLNCTARWIAFSRKRYEIAPAVQSPTRSRGLHPANQDSFTNSAKASKLDSFFLSCQMKL